MNPLPLRSERGEVVTIIIVILVVLGLALGGYKLIGSAADYLAEAIPDEVETNLFAGIAQSQPGWTTRPTTDQHERCLRIFNRLVKNTGLRALKYKMHFVPEKTPNAFALPGGSMAVTDGLLKLLEQDIGLAMVIAHEFGHQQHRHSLKMMGQSLILASAVMLIVGDAGFLVSLALDLARKSYSRENELEADAYGVRMVKDVFGTTRGALEFFEKISKNEPSGRKALSLFSTHPYTPDRLERLKQMMVTLDGPKVLDAAPEGGAANPAKRSPSPPKQKKAEKK